MRASRTRSARISPARASLARVVPLLTSAASIRSTRQVSSHEMTQNLSFLSLLKVKRSVHVYRVRPGLQWEQLEADHCRLCTVSVCPHRLLLHCCGGRDRSRRCCCKGCRRDRPGGGARRYHGSRRERPCQHDTPLQPARAARGCLEGGEEADPSGGIRGWRGPGRGRSEGKNGNL